MPRHHQLTPLYAAMLAALFPLSSQAATNFYVPEDGSMFQMELYEEGESVTFYYHTGDDDPFEADYTLEQSAIDSVRAGWSYWSTILGPTAKNCKPLRVAVAGFDDPDNAGAFSPIGPNGNTYLAEAILNDAYYELNSLTAFIEIGQSSAGWYESDYVSVLPDNGDQFNLTSTMLHEAAHALGITSQVASEPNDNDYTTPYTHRFYEADETGGFSIFSSFLYDSLDNRAEPGMNIVIIYEEYLEGYLADHKDENNFYLVVADGAQSYAQTGVYFSGPHVDEVLNGAELTYPEDAYNVLSGDVYKGTVSGIPINGAEESEDEDGSSYLEPELSHLELQNSLMSHQNWRN